MGKIYQGLGLNTGLIKNEQNNLKRQENYNCDITYVTNSELVFDFLRDSSCLKALIVLHTYLINVTSCWK